MNNPLECLKVSLLRSSTNLDDVLVVISCGDSFRIIGHPGNIEDSIRSCFKKKTSAMSSVTDHVPQRIEFFVIGESLTVGLRDGAGHEGLSYSFVVLIN